MIAGTAAQPRRSGPGGNTAQPDCSARLRERGDRDRAPSREWPMSAGRAARPRRSGPGGNTAQPDCSARLKLDDLLIKLGCLVSLLGQHKRKIAAKERRRKTSRQTDLEERSHASSLRTAIPQSPKIAVLIAQKIDLCPTLHRAGYTPPGKVRSSLAVPARSTRLPSSCTRAGLWSQAIRAVLERSSFIAAMDGRWSETRNSHGLTENSDAAEAEAAASSTEATSATTHLSRYHLRLRGLGATFRAACERWRRAPV